MAKIQITFKCSPDLRDALVRRAAAEQRSLSRYIELRLQADEETLARKGKTR